MKGIDIRESQLRAAAKKRAALIEAAAAAGLKVRAVGGYFNADDVKLDSDTFARMLDWWTHRPAGE